MNKFKFIVFQNFESQIFVKINSKKTMGINMAKLKKKSMIQNSGKLELVISERLNTISLVISKFI
jgi:hypothetical protein